jgi:peptide/nickel transport system substrate-binding protein
MTVIRRTLATVALAHLLSGAAHAATLRFVPDADLAITDPVVSTAITTQNHALMVYDVLFAPDAEWRIRPQMIEAYETSADGLTWTFTLRPGLRFHDGGPVGARDAVPSIQRWGKTNTFGRLMLQHVAAIEAAGDDRFVIRLKSPFAPLLDAIGASQNPLFIMREKEALAPADKAVPEVVGSGPFAFDRAGWKPGHSVTYRRFTDYKPRSEPPSGLAGAKIAKVDAVEWLYIPDPATATQALINGEVDILDQPSADLVPLLRRSAGVEVATIDRLGNQLILRPNHLVPPFNDVRVRQALLLATDQEPFLSVVQGDTALRRPCWSVFLCDTPLETTAGQAHAGLSRAEAVTRAKALLAEAGYKGEPVVLISPSDRPAFKAMGVVAEQLLTEAGFTVNHQVMDWATLVQRRASKEAPSASRAGWSLFPAWGTGPTMSNPFMNTTAPTPCDGRNYFGWPCDERLEAIRKEYLTAVSPEQRRDVNERFHRRFFEVVPYVPVGQVLQPTAYRRELKGVLPDIRLSLWNIEKP